MKLQISRRAQNDLDCIYAFIFERKSPEAADLFLERARAAAEFLAQNPLAGPRLKWPTRHKLLRYWVIGKTNYVIYYLADENGLGIERILDGRRDVARILEKRLDNP